MTDDIDVEALITAIALTIRNAGIPLRSAKAQVSAMMQEAWEAAAEYEAELASLEPVTQSRH